MTLPASLQNLRLPVIGSVAHLDQAALIQILTEPKNALVKQYQRYFSFENAELCGNGNPSRNVPAPSSPPVLVSLNRMKFRCTDGT